MGDGKGSLTPPASQLKIRTQEATLCRPAVNDWVKLAIEADPGVGGDVRFYINDVLAYTGVGERLGANLNTIRLGVNFGNNHDTVWYDDVRVQVPEPTGITLIGIVGVSIASLPRRRR